jgi:hypothetical protein
MLTIESQFSLPGSAAERSLTSCSTAQTTTAIGSGGRVWTASTGLTLLQIDPTAAIAGSAELVPLGPARASYRPADFTRVPAERTLFESGRVRSLPERMPT